jgi:hypothetical protein
MKKGLTIFLVLSTLLIFNCIEYNEKIVINNDGSGKINISYSGPINSDVDSKESKYIFLKGDEYEIQEDIKDHYTSRKVKLKDFYYETSGFNKYVEFVLTFDDVSDLEDVKNFKNNKVLFGKDKDGEYYFERNFPIDGDRDFYDNDNAFEKFIKDAVRDGILDKIKFRFECRVPYEIRISNSDYVRGSKVAKWRFTLGDIIDKKEFTMWCKLR